MTPHFLSFLPLKFNTWRTIHIALANARPYWRERACEACHPPSLSSLVESVRPFCPSTFPARHQFYSVHATSSFHIHAVPSRPSFTTADSRGAPELGVRLPGKRVRPRPLPGGPARAERARLATASRRYCGVGGRRLGRRCEAGERKERTRDDVSGACRGDESPTRLER